MPFDEANWRYLRPVAEYRAERDFSRGPVEWQG